MATHENVAIRWIAGHDKQAKGYAMFFSGDTIYSYGYHFAIARFVDTPRGRVCLFNSEGYSVSTAKHKTIVWRQLCRWRPAMAVFDVPFVATADRDGAHAANVASLRARASEARDKASRARVYGDHWRNVASDLESQAIGYEVAFGLWSPEAKAA